MEITITIFAIVIVLGIISYFIYANLPETKYQEALDILRQGKTNLALTELKKLTEKHDQAGLKIAEIKFQNAVKTIDKNEIDKAIKELKEVLEIRKGIQRSTINKSGFQTLEEKVTEEIAKLYHQKAEDYLRRGKTDLAISEFNETLKWCNKSTQAIKNHSIAELANIYFNLGITNEKGKYFKIAYSEYQKAIDHYQSISMKEQCDDLYSRIEICNFKQGLKPNVDIINGLIYKNNRSKSELLFRFALYLAKENEIEKCENILNYHFKDNTSNEIEKLRSYCNEYYAAIALKEIEKINRVVFDDNVDASSNLYNQIDAIVPLVKKGLPNLSKDVDKLKSYLFSKLISQYFNNNEYDKIIKHISKYPNFYNEPELLKNAGIACLRKANDEEITTSNYEYIISTWLTTVYSDKVILNSLESTTWDDDYTFTLIDSIGSEYYNEIELENVNYEEVSESNISIGAVQRELVSYFEAAINNISDSRLSRQVHEFYYAEKESLEKVIKTIDEEIFYATPHFAKEHDLNDIILEYLASEFEVQQDTKILQIGLRYVKYRKPSVFEQFEIAQKFITACSDAIKHNNLSNLKSQNTSTNKSALSKFSDLTKEFEDDLVKAFNSISDKEEENENIIPLFEEAINISTNKDQLKYQFVNFIADLCVAKINGKKMKYERGLDLLVKAFQLQPDNSRVAHNLAILTKFNCMDMINGGVSTTCRNKLQEVVKIKNQLLIQNLRNELSEIFYTIMQQIEQNDSDVVKLFEDAIGIRTARQRSAFDRLMFPSSYPYSNKTLNDVGREMASKMKIIYQLMGGTINMKILRDDLNLAYYTLNYGIKYYEKPL